MIATAELRSTAASRLACALIAIMIAIAGVHAWRVTSPLTWPYDADLFRDAAAAQTILDGDPLSDPFYRGETLWYNPLVPALVATTSWGTGIRVPTLYARAGVVLNLLTPIAFAALVWILGGPWASVAATAIFIFCPSPTSPPTSWPSYSPWLFPAVFAQALFYVTLITLHRAYASERFTPYVIVGCMLGLTFLAHTAPALLVGSIMALEAANALWRRNAQSRVCLTGTLLALACAAAISLPLAISIVGRYHLRVLNPVPASWESGELLLKNFQTLVRGALSIPSMLAIAGVAVLIFDPHAKQARRVAPGWLMVNAAWLGWIYACQLAPGRGWAFGSVVPDYHFLFYWRALAAVLGGIGAFGLARVAASLVSQVGQRVLNLTALAYLPAAFLTAAVAGAMPFVYPGFASRFDFTSAVSRSLPRSEHQPEVMAADWIRRETPRDAVFLSYDEVSLYVVGPTGRKVLAVGAFFSNPYVDRAVRIDARRVMWDALRAGDEASFCRTARPFAVTHVVLGEDHSTEWAPKMQSFLAPAFSAGHLRIWRVVGCSGGRG
ncbi:MAG TPA: hypothetical protein VMZ90_02265 [Vicinamibacterales bacterium]|nr:hypothetical protein [Vicinamibacterales bacterium]